MGTGYASAFVWYCTNALSAALQYMAQCSIVRVPITEMNNMRVNVCGFAVTGSQVWLITRML